MPAILCVEPVETVADKLSACAWRSIARDRSHPEGDPTILRHLHDLAALEAVAGASNKIPAMLLEVLRADTARWQGAVQDLPPHERHMAMLDRVKGNPEYPAEYRQFVEGMAFAGAADGPDFDQAVSALERLCALLENASVRYRPGVRVDIRRRSESTKAPSSSAGTWICRPTPTASRWISHDPERPPAMPTSKPSTGASRPGHRLVPDACRHPRKVGEVAQIPQPGWAARRHR